MDELIKQELVELEKISGLSKDKAKDLIMKKELNALVNLGAIIGFILGLSNLLF